MTSEQEGVTPFQYHIYAEYETPSQQYENGQITYFDVCTGLPRPCHNTTTTLAHLDEAGPEFFRQMTRTVKSLG